MSKTSGSKGLGRAFQGSRKQLTIRGESSVLLDVSLRTKARVLRAACNLYISEGADLPLLAELEVRPNSSANCKRSPICEDLYVEWKCIHDFKETVPHFMLCRGFPPHKAKWLWSILS